jgi:hypothetical protein
MSTTTTARSKLPKLVLSHAYPVGVGTHVLAAKS